MSGILSSTFDAGSLPYRLISLTPRETQNFQALGILWKTAHRKVHSIVERVRALETAMCVFKSCLYHLQLCNPGLSYLFMFTAVIKLDT